LRLESLVRLDVLSGLEPGVLASSVEEPTAPLGVEGLDVIEQSANRPVPIHAGVEEDLNGHAAIFALEGGVEVGADRLADRLVAILEGDPDLPAHGCRPSLRS
jgi:hypothetical protein